MTRRTPPTVMLPHGFPIRVVDQPAFSGQLGFPTRWFRDTVADEGLLTKLFEKMLPCPVAARGSGPLR